MSPLSPRLSIFEYMSMVVAIVLGISITNLLNKLAITLRVGNWGQLWYRPLWCVILLVCTVGYLWAFWRIYIDYTEISIWSFIFGPFFHCSLFLPDIGIITYFLGDEGRPRFFKVLFGTKETFLHSFGSDVDTP